MSPRKGSNPLVSVVVPTYNSATFLEACLQSIKHQTYQNIELIVVDNNSTDITKQLARDYTDRVFNKGPERSAQRNYGVKKSKGEYVLMIDSDMELTKHVVSSCVEKASHNLQIEGIIVPEESFGDGFWAQCKKLERSFYVGVDAIEAARFFRKTTYEKVGGYDDALVSGEDWELTRRIRKNGTIVHIDEFIRHNEGRLSLLRTLKKKYYYAKRARPYIEKAGITYKMMDAAGPLLRYKLFLSHPVKLLSNPVIGIAMLIMKTCEYIVGGFGYVGARKGKT